MHDGVPFVLETEKQRNLTRGSSISMINNAPGWNERHATEAEANVKAIVPRGNL
ncbi:hypothetical protein BDV98DRAFT_571228 [Pterulicium gracile]|uniref:Uncharacterized protein n=1 Tax=Pterulicium gracile TaxID=1884261 RepID=A0A5C3QER9_9AGAR|nr:hypothetical protein BDV98DRAFT_571228 [Pterula gracilis]